MDEQVKLRRGARLDGTLRRWWKLLVVAGIVAALGSWIVVSRAPETFPANTRLVVGPFAGNTDMMRAAGTQARTDAEVAKAQSLLADAAHSLGLSPDQIKDVEVDARADEATRTLDISVRDRDPARAADLANALAVALGARIKEQPVGPEAMITVLDPATVPGEADEPNVLRPVTLSVLATLVLSFGVAYLLDRRREGEFEDE
jgi:capsular polysaccharide biosynthesis protein